MTTPSPLARLALDDAATALDTTRDALDRVRHELADTYGTTGTNLTAAAQAIKAAEHRADQAEEAAEQHTRNTATVARERESYRAAWKDEQAKRAQAERVARSAAQDAADAIRRADQAEDLLRTAHQCSNDAERARAAAEKRADRLAEELAERSKRDGRTEATLQRVRDAGTLAQALAAVAEHDGLSPVQAAMSAAFAAAAETPAAVDTERERDHAIELAEAKEAARVAQVAAHKLKLQTPDRAQRTLDRIRDARTSLEAWVTLGMYYGMTPEQTGQSARAWRTTDERITYDRIERLRRRLAEEAEDHTAAQVAADRFEAAWQNARLRAKDAKEREQHARDRAERYRTQRNRWVEIADEHTDKERDRANTAEAAIGRVRALHSPVDHNGRTICADCSGYADGSTDNGPAPHPCPTITVLDTPTEVAGTAPAATQNRGECCDCPHEMEA